MVKLYFQSIERRLLYPLMVIFVLMHTSLFSQDDPTVERGIIRIKFSEEFAAQVEAASMKRSSGGEIVTGISSLDQLNKVYHVAQLRRVFRYAGKNESRHRKYGLHRWYELTLKVPGNELSAVTSYRSLQHIERAEPVYKKAIIGEGRHRVVTINNPMPEGTFSPQAASNDPMLTAQWHYNNTGQSGGQAGADIKLFQAWQKEAGKQDVIVAVTDGGIQTNHPDLAANMWVNTQEIAGNGIDDDNNGYVDDIHGYSFVESSGDITPDNHGTHVAGTIAAVTNNGRGVAGVAGGTGQGDGVRLMTCAVFAGAVSGGFPDAYVYAADHGALISQNSWNYTTPDIFEQSVIDAINYFIAEAGKDSDGNQIGKMNGGIVIFSAGNEASQQRYYPSYYAKALAVAATTHTDTKAIYSNYGEWVDIAAPGGETHNVTEQGVLSTLSGNSYGYYQGTSMACPHVSGVAALVISKFGKQGFSPDVLRSRLQYTAANIDVQNPSYRGQLGAGRLDAARALQDGDVTAPAVITNLAVTTSVIGKVTLQWKAPADVGSFTASYDVRYSTSPITEANFNQATRGGHPAATVAAGQTETFTVSGLPGGTGLYFAVKAFDFENNVSALSNVIFHTTAFAPVIQASPSSITKSLLTAQTGTAVLVIRNTGKGPLDFTIPNATGKNDFAICAPASGTVAQGSQMSLTITFSANALAAGTHQKDLMIVSNDPLRSEIKVPLILKVSPNGAPIMRIEPASLNFKSVQVNASATRHLKIYNAGSATLQITGITFNNTSFTTSVTTPVTVASFQEFVLPVQFKPLTTGVVTGSITLQTNDPANNTRVLTLTGEGLTGVPVTITPNTLAVTLDKGTTVNKVLTLTNHGAFERGFAIQSAVRESPAHVSVQGRQSAASSSQNNNIRQTRETLLSKINTGEIKIDPLLRAIRKNNNQQSVPGITQGRKAANALEEYRYETDFEDFTSGAVQGQQGWTGFQGWNISSTRPDKGLKHLRGTAVTPGTEVYAMTPSVFGEDYGGESIFTTFTTRVNLDDMDNAIWEIVAQDLNFIVGRVRFNPDRTIDVMSVDAQYNTVWKTVNVDLPSGYFNVAIEHNGFGDGSSGFPVFDVFINDKKVLSGLYSLGSLIDNVTFICNAISPGGHMDIDGVSLREGRFTPAHIVAVPKEGVIAAGQSVQVAIQVDASSLRYGEYETAIITSLDETEEIITPISIQIVGEGSMEITPASLQISGVPVGDGYADMILANTGGEEIEYTIEKSLPHVNLNSSSGSLPVERKEWVNITYEDPTPGLYFDTLRIRTNLENNPVFYRPLQIIQWEPRAQFQAATKVMQVEIPKGELKTASFTIENDGTRQLSYKVLSAVQPGFSVEPVSGVLDPGEPAVSITVQLDATILAEGQGTKSFTIMTNDPASPLILFTVNYTVLPKNVAGKISREVWRNVTGLRVSAIPVQSTPTAVTYLTKLDGPVNDGDQYGARIRGYIQAPETGTYTFWIAGDDACELWLSTTTDPAGKTRIAYLDSFVPRGNYTKIPSQKSAAIQLQSGQRYYIEVLHKENKGGDHISVGWDMPGGKKEFPIPGKRLYPLDVNGPSNTLPVVTVTSPYKNQVFTAPASINIQVNASDEDGEVVKVEFYNGGQKIGVDASAPFSFQWNDVQPGNYDIIAKVVDNAGASASASVPVSVSSSPCAGNGVIRREVWRNISGSKVSAIPLDVPADELINLTLFETPTSDGDNYGSRMRGFVCVPITGNYTFWIAGDNDAELWLSADENPLNKVSIASVSGFTSPRQWQKYPSQRSAAISLVAGNRYYIEALHKEAKTNDNFAVGWTLPDGTHERPMPGKRLIPFDMVEEQTSQKMTEVASMNRIEAGSNLVLIHPNPVHRGNVTVQLPIDNSHAVVKIAVITTSGKVLWERETSTVDTPGIVTFLINDDMTPGVYLVKVMQGNTYYSRRLVVH